MFKVTLLIYFTILNFKLFQCKKYYNNHTLFRGMPADERHLEFFKNISERYDVNFWRSPGLVNMPIEFTVGPEDRQTLQTEADKRGIHLKAIIPDIQSAFDKQTVKAYIRRNLESFNWQDYYGLDDIYSWLRDLKKVHSSEMQIVKMGRTWENRMMLAVIITLTGCKLRSTVVVEGGIHAREWISPAFVTYMLQEILRAPNSNDSSLHDIALTYKWIFIPVVNPDGYEYSHTEDRQWRKNRRYPSGVDINRNFDIAFGTVGVRHNAKSEVYCGSHPFSEREARAMANLIKANSETLEYYIGFHSYGQCMIIPYAHHMSHIQNYNEVEAIVKIVKKQIQRRHGTVYRYGTAFDTVGYQTSGVSADWVKLKFQVPYVVTFELRDNGEFGFALPPKDILPTCKETMDGVLTLLKLRPDKHNKLEIDHFFNRHQETRFDKIVLTCALCHLIVPDERQRPVHDDLPPFANCKSNYWASERLP